MWVLLMHKGELITVHSIFSICKMCVRWIGLKVVDIFTKNSIDSKAIGKINKYVAYYVKIK